MVAPHRTPDVGLGKKAEEESVSDLWAALTQLPRPTLNVPFPRMLPGTEEPVGMVAIWALTQKEQMDANAEADRYTKALLKDPQRKEEANLGYHHTYANEGAVQVLWRACRRPDDLSQTIFPSPKLMRDRMTTDEIGVLFKHYLTAQLELGPIIAYLTAEEQEAMVLRLQRDGSEHPFNSLSWEQQKTLVLGMASRLVSCWTVIRSAGLPLDVSTYAQEQLDELIEQAKATQEKPGPAPADDDTSAPETDPDE